MPATILSDRLDRIGGFHINTGANPMPSTNSAHSQIERYTAALSRYEAASIETAKDVAAARARGDLIMAAALDAIHKNLAPVHPVAAAVALARRHSREAWKLKAGLIEAREGAADDWCERLKAEAARQMNIARDIRFELVLLPIEHAMARAA